MYMREATRESSLSDAWREALTLFDRDLSVRSAAEATRRAYSNDVGQLAEWANATGRDPEALGHRELRRFAAVLSERGISKAGVARKLAAIRAFYGALIRAGEASANPADLVATPKRERKLPRVLSREEMQTLLDRIPTRTPLEMRDRAMLELAYS
jgi:site-specific recombinase XerD